MSAIGDSLIQELPTDRCSQPLNQVASENISLLPKERSACCLRFKFRGTICPKSKSVILILIWSFFAYVLQCLFIDPYFLISVFTQLLNRHYDVNFIYVIVPVFAYIAVVRLFYPLAGLLADVRYGRYKCVIYSQWSFIGGSLLIGVGIVVGWFLYYLLQNSHSWSFAIFILLLIFFGLLVIIGLFLFFVSIVAFNANIIQFGMDQLHDSPTDYLVTYIRWFVLLIHIADLIIKVLLSFLQYYVVVLLAVPVTIYIGFYVLFLFSLCVGLYKRRAWFVFDGEVKNPYKLVYRVVSFGLKHKNPIRRSAFTYCEDELPSRLDLGKEKYGGPFTTEQVENVKVFFGILQLLISLGPFLAIERSTYCLLSIFSNHLSPNSTAQSTIMSFHSIDSIQSLIVLSIFCLYLIFLRPFIHFYIPGMLKRVKFGMILMITPALCIFILDTIGHTKASRDNNVCFLMQNSGELSLGISRLFLLIPLLTGSCGYLCFYIALYEFIYAQSPHSMKGLLIGTFFAVRGTFQLLGVLLFILPFLGWRSSSSFPSCGFVYYLVNILVAIIGFILFARISKNYRYRQRDEPDNVYRYAEEYYEGRDTSSHNITDDYNAIKDNS